MEDLQIEETPSKPRFFSFITTWLQNGGSLGEESASNMISLYAALCSFLSYFLVYGFRKAWSSATWEDQSTLFGFSDPKLFLDWSQIFGYVIGKFIGIFLIPSTPKSFRFFLLLSLPLLSTVVWFMLGILHSVSTVLVFFCFFFSAMPLSMAWSLLYLYLEGRNNPDFLGAVLSASLIIGSSVAKTIGSLILNTGLNQYWMPFAVSLCYLCPFIMMAFLTQAIPEPTPEERKKMNTRQPMTQSEKLEFLKSHFIGVLALTTPYMLVTSARDFRDTFTVDIFKSFGDNEEDVSSFIFLLDVPVGFSVCAFLICLTFVKDNRKNILYQLGLMGAGYGLILLSQTLFTLDWVGEIVWYMGSGIGVYLAYTPVAAMFYDRLGGALPWSGTPGTATFMIQFSDFCGYIGTIILYTIQGFGGLGGGESESNGISENYYYNILETFFFVVGVTGMIGIFLCTLYWGRVFYQNT